MLRVFYAHLYLSVTDFEFYPRIFRRPLSETLRFLLLLSAAVSIVLTLLYAWRWFPEADDFVAWAEANIPPFEIREGRFEAAVEQPFLAKYENGPLTFVFDTTGVYADPAGLEEPVFLLAEERLFVRIEGQTSSYAWEDFGTVDFHPDDLPRYAGFLKMVFFPGAYSLLLVYTLAAKAFTALILSPLAFSVGLSRGVRLTFSNCFTVAVHSLVPAVAVDLAVRMTTVTISYFDFIYLGVAAIYTFLATQRCAVAD